MVVTMEIRVALFRICYDVSELVEFDRLTVQFYELLYTSLLFCRTRKKFFLFKILIPLDTMNKKFHESLY